MKPPRRFTPVTDGEWVQPRPKSYFMKCCDCGLVHRMNFRIVTGRRQGKRVQRVQFQAFRVAADEPSASSVSACRKRR